MIQSCLPLLHTCAYPATCFVWSNFLVNTFVDLYAFFVFPKSVWSVFVDWLGCVFVDIVACLHRAAYRYRWSSVSLKKDVFLWFFAWDTPVCVHVCQCAVRYVYFNLWVSNLCFFYSIPQCLNKTRMTTGPPPKKKKKFPATYEIIRKDKDETSESQPEAQRALTDRVESEFERFECISSAHKFRVKWSNVAITCVNRKFSRNHSLADLRGAWRDHCFPEPFSWFLHETGLESLKITSARRFLFKCQRKDSKKAKEHRQFRGVLGRWRTAAIDRTIFHACQRCRKTAVFAVFFSALGCHLARESFSWRAMPVSNRKEEFEQRERIKLFDDFWGACVPIRFCSEAPASSTVDVNSRFSRFHFSAFWSNGLASSVFIFAPILLRFFILRSSMQGLQYVVTDFLISTCEKSYASSKPTG